MEPDAGLDGAVHGRGHGGHHARVHAGDVLRPQDAFIVALAAVVFAGGLYLARSQRTVGDVAWIRAMIPHHSIAILTGERAHLTDPRVRKLADEIIQSQRREIAEREALIAELEKE